MDIFEESKYCNFVIDKYYSQDNPVDPNIVSGYGEYPATPDNAYDYGTPIFHYPDDDTIYYAPTDKKVWDEQNPLPTEKPIDKVPYTPPENTPISPLSVKSQTGNELKEFVKKPEVIGIGALIIAVLIYKII